MKDAGLLYLLCCALAVVVLLAVLALTGVL